jgi:peptidoglycan hydrolase CwlO-like protein
MSHKFYLKKRINELQAQIDNKYGQVEALQKELQELKVKEFEEDLREEDERMLLKG